MWQVSNCLINAYVQYLLLTYSSMVIGEVHTGATRMIQNYSAIEITHRERRESDVVTLNEVIVAYQPQASSTYLSALKYNCTVQTTPDKVQITPDKVQTTQDKVWTTPDKVQTTQDKVWTTPDKVQITPDQGSISITLLGRCPDRLSVIYAQSDLWLVEIYPGTSCLYDEIYYSGIALPADLFLAASTSEIVVDCQVVPKRKLAVTDHDYFPTVVVLVVIIIIHAFILLAILVWVGKRANQTHKPFHSQSQATSRGGSRTISLSSPAPLLTPTVPRQYGSFSNSHRLSLRRYSEDASLTSWVIGNENSNSMSRRKKAQAVSISPSLPEENQPMDNPLGTIDCTKSDLHIRRQKSKPQIVISMIEETV